MRAGDSDAGANASASGTKRARGSTETGSVSPEPPEPTIGGFGEIEVEVAGAGPAEAGRDGGGRADGGSERSTSDWELEEEDRGRRKRDLYDVLGVAFDATEGQIRNAYLRSALRNHPDKHGGTEEAKARFQEIGEAYFVLSDPDRRAVYDDSAEFDVYDYGVEEYLLRFRTFVLTTQGLSLGSVAGEEDLEVQEEIARFLGFAS